MGIEFSKTSELNFRKGSFLHPHAHIKKNPPRIPKKNHKQNPITQKCEPLLWHCCYQLLEICRFSMKLLQQRFLYKFLGTVLRKSNEKSKCKNHAKKTKNFGKKFRVKNPFTFSWKFRWTVPSKILRLF